VWQWLGGSGTVALLPQVALTHNGSIAPNPNKKNQKHKKKKHLKYPKIPQKHLKNTKKNTSKTQKHLKNTKKHLKQTLATISLLLAHLKFHRTFGPYSLSNLALIATLFFGVFALFPFKRPISVLNHASLLVIGSFFVTMWVEIAVFGWKNGIFEVFWVKKWGF
jgi:hypothetical protein